MARNWGEESWENIVNQVVIDGRPGDLRTAALGWEAVLRNLNSVKTSLDQNVKDLGTVWKGEAYEAFKKHIETISEKIQKVADEANGGGGGGVVASLNKTADDLHAAQEKIPIPIAMQPDVMEARNSYLTIPIGSFENAIKVDIAGAMGAYRDLGNALTGGLAQKVWTAVQDAVTNGSDEALGYWKTLNGQVADTTEVTPAGTPVDVANQTPYEQVPTGSGGPSGGVGGVSGGGGMGGAPKLGADPSGIGSGGIPGGGAYDPTGGSPYTPPINDGTSGFDPDAGTGYTPGVDTGFDPKTGSGTGLAGAGGGLGTGGLGGGGLGSGGLSGLGAGGLGAGGGSGGGIGSGGLPGGGALGKPVSGAALGGMAGMAGMGGMGAGAGARGAGKGGAGKGGKPMLSGGVAGGKSGAGRPGAAGLAGMGGGPGAGFGGEEERSTWLQEDEDVWGGGDAAPGVLR
ncbi:WXG100 family type VII secretion target [Catenuloplanes atrovinosus]|uniref:WXG100 family type VII secretion target n=1 Tax=Catenuloplanes atrovinosus TaxID=137266 RepID=A0AAE3YTU2_9ACTN|nr:hypothetical protein [Catenuloplanes atrovinosus]MDR7278536.1 hypothetical protein [Catenuloplanes atrovinosus]